MGFFSMHPASWPAVHSIGFSKYDHQKTLVFHKMLNTGLLHDSAILRSIGLKELKACVQTKMCALVSQEALFTITKRCKEFSAHQEMNEQTKGSNATQWNNIQL